MHAVGFELVFDEARSATIDEYAADDTLTQIVKRDRKKSSQLIGLQAESNETINTMRLIFSVRPAFASGGQLIAHEGPNGIVDSASNPLIGDDEGVWGEDGTFIILPRTCGITG
jgi:hypothetical protein